MSFCRRLSGLIAILRSELPLLGFGKILPPLPCPGNDASCRVFFGTFRTSVYITTGFVAASTGFLALKAKSRWQVSLHKRVACQRVAVIHRAVWRQLFRRSLPCHWRAVISVHSCLPGLPLACFIVVAVLEMSTMMSFTTNNMYGLMLYFFFIPEMCEVSGRVILYYPTKKES